jgi:hypothetical protein
MVREEYAANYERAAAASEETSVDTPPLKVRCTPLRSSTILTRSF